MPGWPQVWILIPLVTQPFPLTWPAVGLPIDLPPAFSPIRHFLSDRVRRRGELLQL